MADGIRIQPTRERLAEIGDPAGRLIVVRDLSRPIAVTPTGPICHFCGYRHDCKTYHLQLDAEGAVIVSTTVWGRLQRLFDCGGFEPVNVVTKPPTQGFFLQPATKPKD